MKIKSLLFLLLALVGMSATAQRLKPSTKPNACQQRVIERGYGMFVHFGMNTFNGFEWSEGKDPATLYNPTNLDCDQWARVARDAGFRYILLVTKHHDGFCLWDSRYIDYDVASSPVKTDVVKAVSDACRKYGLELGLYYSLWDRHEPSYKSSDFSDYLEYMDGQLNELLTNYGDICELWFDGGWDKPAADWNVPHIYDHVKKLQPKCAVGFNVSAIRPIGEDKGGFDMFPVEDMVGNPDIQFRYFPTDFRLYDPKIAHPNDAKLYNVDGKTYYLPFEHTICLSYAYEWFQKAEPQPVRDLVELRELFYLSTANNNTLVINLPPDQTGRIPQHEANTAIALARMIGIEHGKPLPKGGEIISVGAKAEATSVWDDTGDWDASKATDGGMQTRWASRDTVAQLVFYPDPEKKFNVVNIYEYCDSYRDANNRFHRTNRITDYSLDIFNEADGSWTPIYVSTSAMGDCKSISLPEPISASRVRLNIRSAVESPSIYEIQLINR